MSGLGPDTDECQRSRRPGMGTYTVALRGLGQKPVVRCPDFIGDFYQSRKQVLATIGNSIDYIPLQLLSYSWILS